MPISLRILDSHHFCSCEMATIKYLHFFSISGHSASRSEEHTSELQSPMSTLFPYTTLFRSQCRYPCASLIVITSVRAKWRQSNICISSLSAAIVLRDRKSTRLNSSHRCIHSFPTRRSSDLNADIPAHP